MLTWLALSFVLAADGEAVRLPVVRDTWFSNVGPEADGANGGAEKLKVKSIQEMSLVDFDPAPLQGRIVSSALLHVRLSGDERLQRMTVGGFSAPWVEGTATGYAPQAGSSTHNHREHPDVAWSHPGGDLCDVILGRSAAMWHSSAATAPDADGWQQIVVEPRVIAARAAGISYGCFVFDDTGSEWTRDGEKFSLRLFPNRFFYSREAGQRRAPYFTVVLGPRDDEPPAAPAELKASAGDLPAGEAWVSWRTPADKGPAGTLGFFVEVDGRSVPRYLIPAARDPGEWVTMHLRDLNLAAGAQAVAKVSAVDGAGNRGAAAQATIALSSRRGAELPPAPESPERPLKGKLPRLGQAEIAIIDALDKVQPASGKMVPEQPVDYLASNHLWNAAEGRVRLYAAKNEFVDFQLLVRGDAPELQVKLVFDDEPEIKSSLGRLGLVATKRGPLPDPVIDLGDGFAAAAKPSANSAAPLGQKSDSYLAELYVPHRTKAGEHRGMLQLRSGQAALDLPIVLTVWDFTLPDFLSFLPEMNCYGLPENERDYYRLAHRHRTVLNRVPYHQNGAIAEGCAPTWDGRRLDWSAWDRRFGAYLDGTAFDDMPRRGVPLECFYLPLHENWPSTMADNYRGGYWADEAFGPAYREAFVAASRQMAEHFGERGWNETIFQCFLNGKNNFKAGGWSRGSSPWLLDEPANFQDYWALRYFGLAFHAGVGQAKSEAKMFFRADISRPEWQREVLDDALDYNVVGGALRRYRRIVLDRKQATGQTVLEYGSANAIEDSNVQPAAWCVDAWSLGVDGVVPWQTIGSRRSWQDADALSLFYPGEEPGGSPAPSLRLKAFLRGEQDVEYLTLWMQATGQPRWAAGDAVREALHLAGERRGTGAGGEDAGVIHYAQLRPVDLWNLRVRIGRDLSARRPAAAKRLVEFRPIDARTERVSPN